MQFVFVQFVFVQFVFVQFVFVQFVCMTQEQKKSVSGHIQISKKKT